MNQTELETFYLWIDKAHTPPMNMALDEALLSQANILSACILRFYDWNRKSMSIGYIQRYADTFRAEYELVRRPTGGGVVFHDIDLTYTVVIPTGHWIEMLSREKSYFLIHKIIIKALATLGLESELVDHSHIIKDRMNMQCFTSPARFDVSSQKDGITSKIAGAAQRRTKLGILHQGSIVLEDMNNKKKVVREKITKAFESELKACFNEFKLNKPFLLRARKLAKEKYSTDLWNKTR